jgi:hypothetical protein
MFLRILSASILCSAVQVHALEIDFSKAYLIPHTRSTQLRIGGVVARDASNSSIQEILLGFNEENLSFPLVSHQAQNAFDAEWVSQQLRATVWRGTYNSGNNVYQTEFYLNGMSNGMITGEMVHRSPDPQVSSLLRALVGGILSTEYFVDLQGNGHADWVDARTYTQKIQQIDQDNQKSNTSSKSYPTVQDTRYYLRLKRLLALEVKNGGGNWGANAEYRINLDKNNHMSGSVGTPPDDYNSDTTSNNGILTLEKVN